MLFVPEGYDVECNGCALDRLPVDIPGALERLYETASLCLDSLRGVGYQLDVALGYAFILWRLVVRPELPVSRLSNPTDIRKDCRC